MAANFSQNKGKRCERAVVEMLQPIVDKVTTELGRERILLVRNSLQSRLSGCDIVGLNWLAIEVKCQEQLNINSWIKQCIKSAGDTSMPVLFYKQNRQAWTVGLYGSLITGGSYNLKAWCEVSVDSFLQFFEMKLRHELAEESK